VPGVHSIVAEGYSYHLLGIWYIKTFAPPSLSYTVAPPVPTGTWTSNNTCPSVCGYGGGFDNTWSCIGGNALCSPATQANTWCNATAACLVPSVDTLTATPNPISYNTPSTLTWSASGGVTACYITGGIYTSGVWYGTYVGGPNGFRSTGNLIADTTYMMNCHNGTTWAANPKSVTVTVTNPATLKICPNPCTVSGTSFNGRTIIGVPTTPLYACYGTGDCSAPDTNVSATWSAE
jgi:hypothetical protein